MQLGHDHFGRGDALGRVHVDRNAAAIVGDFGRAIGVKRDRHTVCMTGKRLIDGIVHNFVDHVVQARAVIGVADIHAGAFADRFQALQDLDRASAIFGGFSLRAFGHKGLLIDSWIRLYL